MSGGVPDELIAAARAYESLHVPALFSEWAPRVADAARVETGDRVLDVACGTGVLTREVARRAGAETVTGLDLDPGMLAVARELLPEAEWIEGDAGSMPLDDTRFDAVVSQFALMFFPDRERALVEMRRVLEPDGRIAVAVWASLEETPIYATEVALLERIAGESAANALRAPFVLGDADGLAALFERAGLGAPSISTITGSGRFPSVRTMVEADLRGWLPLMGVRLDEETIERILREAETDLAPWIVDEGAVEFPSPGLIATWTEGDATSC